MAKDETEPNLGKNQVYDVTYKWRRGDRTGFTTIGIAFANADGSIRLSLNAVPVPGLAERPDEYVLYPRGMAAPPPA